MSRAELADRLDLTRPRLLAELERLVGCRATSPRPAWPRPGADAARPWSSCTRSLRFAAVDLGASSIDVEVTNGRLEPVAAYRRGGRHPLRPEGDPAPGQRAARQGPRRRRLRAARPRSASACPGRSASATVCRSRRRSCPAGTGTRCGSCSAREHGCPAVVDNDVNIMAIGERHGGVAHSVDDFLFVKIGTGIGCGIHLGGDVYRGIDGCAGDIGHIQVDAARSDLLLRQHRLPGGPVQRGGAGPGRTGRGPHRHLARARRAARRAARGHRSRRRRGRRPRATSPASS